ncbi:MAG: leucine-rich repeat domain-containing protein [Treponema sp.]|nr:leucine-rich repeat domain-containing protein [Treponema sp.]
MKNSESQKLRLAAAIFLLISSCGTLHLYAGAWGKAFKETFKAMKNSAKSVSDDYGSKRRKAMGEDFEKENSKDDFIYDLTEDGEGVIIKGYQGTRNIVTVPAQIEDFPVTHIAENGLTNEIITGISLPDSVISIAPNSFSENLEIAFLPETMKCLPSRLFQGGKLASIEIPEVTEEISPSTFYYCKSLTNISFSEAGNLKYIGDAGGEYLSEGAFEGCSIEKKLIIPSGVEVIGDRSFSGTNIVSVEIPSTVQIIGADAFKDCPNLEKVTFEKSDKTLYIMPGVFDGCPYFNKIDFSERKVVWCSELSFKGGKSFAKGGYSMDNIKFTPATAKNTGFKGCSEFKLSERKVLRDLGYKGEF